jgi:hypothetical protein
MESIPIPEVGNVEVPSEKKHIFVATPMYGGQCFGFFTQGCLQLQKLAMNSGLDLTFSFLFNESLIQRGRNLLANAFLKSKCTHMLFIDSDIRFQPEQILPMLDADKDIICGIYPKKEINWQTVRKAMDAGVPDSELKNHTGNFVVNLVNYEETVTVPIGEPLEIWNGGTGFMLIKREVYEGLVGKLPTYLNNVMDIQNPQNGEKINEFFATCIEEESGLLLSEDYYFCKKARENGFKVWAAPWVDLAHVGTYAFEGQLLKTP